MSHWVNRSISFLLYCLLTLCLSAKLVVADSNPDALSLVNTSTTFEKPSSSELVENQDGLYIAKVELHTAEELQELFDRAEAFLTEKGQSQNTSAAPIAVVLHGPEVSVFQRKNYQQFKMLVDQAARLDESNIIDVQICRIWMSIDDITEEELPEFVQTVPNGPARERKLLDAGYNYF